MGLWDKVADVAEFVAPYAAGISSAYGQDQANRTNVRIAREQMQFQERMSSSAYQRATADMKMSGINPALAYMQGGASSPGGASATVQDAVGPGVSSALHAARLKKELQLLDAQTGKTVAEADGQLIKNELERTVGPDVLDPAHFPSGVPIGRLFLTAQQRRAALEETRSRISRNQAGTALDRADLPARNVQGSRIAGILKVLFGGGAVTGAVGAGKGLRPRPRGLPSRRFGGR